MRMLILATALTAAIPAAFVAAAPAMAQSGGRTLTVYGDDPCPTSNNEEIVICKRLPETERFRIPLEVRAPTAGTESTAGAVRNQRIVDAEVGSTGTGSCSTVGANGGSGCFAQSVRRNREARQEKGEAPLVDF